MDEVANRSRIVNFEQFVGKTVAAVDAECINVVRFEFTDGTTIAVDADEYYYDIAVIQVSADLTFLLVVD
jgi:hypothetical protein